MPVSMILRSSAPASVGKIAFPNIGVRLADEFRRVVDPRVQRHCAIDLDESPLAGL